MGDKLDWKNVLYFNEIQYYLNRLNIIHLSMCCKLLRKKIHSDSIKTLNLTDFIKRRNYKFFKFESIAESIMCINPFDPPNDKIQNDVYQFTLDLQTFTHPVQQYTLDSQMDYFYSYKVIDTFDTITNLKLSFCKLSLNLFQYMLSNLNLTQLTVESITVFNDKPEFRVTLPQSLVKVTYFLSYARLLKRDNAPIGTVTPGYSEMVFPFFLEPQYISELKILNYTKLTADSFNFDQFLILNPQLKSITACPDIFSWKNLQYLHLNNQIEHLEIVYYPLTRFLDMQCPILTNLKSFKTVIYRESDKSLDIIKACPNLIKFEITFEDTQDIYKGIYIASDMKKLKHFSISLDNIDSFDKLIDFPIMNKLEILEFSEFNPKDLDWSQLTLFPKLKMVKFYSEYVGTSQKLFQSKNENTDNWKLAYYSDSIVYYKI